MSIYPFMTLFSSTLFLSTLIALSSNHWLMMWMALELNMISFIPLMSSSSWFQETEGAVKYFMFQALGSSLLLLGSTTNSMSIVIMLGLMVKLGLAPFHFWFPSVMNSISWSMCLLLATWQKLIPMLALIILFYKTAPMQVLLIASISAITGGLGGLNQTQLRPLLAYSSIGHMGWMISSISISPSISFMYLMTYIMISIPLMMVANKSNMSSTKFSLASSSSPLYPLLFIIILLSLGGLPPFTGFLPKWITLAAFSSITLPLFLVMGSLMNLFYYMNIMFSVFLNSSFNKKNLHQSGPPLLINVMSLLATLSMPLLLVLM